MTVLQKQCLLRYLGYDTGGVDGIEGPRTRAAAKAFRAAEGIGDGDDLEAALKAAVAREKPEQDSFWAGIRWFSRGEFACKCGRCGGFPAEPDRVLVTLAEDMRMDFGLPMIVSSGLRCPAHNKAVGGAAGSRHMVGKAVDFSVPGKTAAQILAAVSRDGRVRYAYAIDENHVHMDVA